MGTNKSRKKGQAIVIVALLITVLLLFVGLAIDSGIGYGVKAKLSSAVDAAALAAGKALGQPATDDNARRNNAILAARTFFAANFPSSYLMATPTLQDPVVVHDPATGQWNITITASASVPTIFLKLGGRKTFTAQAVAGATRRDLDMAFVIDTTDSMLSVSSAVKADAITFVNYFIDSSDRMALLHFAYGTVVDNSVSSARGFNKTSVISHINSLDYNLGGFTNFSEAFWRARDQLINPIYIPVADRSSLRVIVFFTDGSPNSLSATFTHNAGLPSQTRRTGVIQTASEATGTPEGLWDVGQQNHRPSDAWNQGTSIRTYISSALPTYFNCIVGNTNPNADIEFPIWPHAAVGPRHAVDSSTTYANINRASRNLPEDMALKARQAGIFVYTLGLGSHLQDQNGPDYETGEPLLKRMANDPTADTYDPSQPVGLYCYAADPEELKNCFDKVASKILRLTK